MFIRMTGTEGVRPEIAIEAAHHTNGPWIELPFRYKPTDPGRALRKVPPCSPARATPRLMGILAELLHVYPICWC